MGCNNLITFLRPGKPVHMTNRCHPVGPPFIHSRCSLALYNKSTTTSFVCIDFSWAFDMVSKSTLLSKLRFFNIAGDFVCFITDRTRVNNSLWELKELISGVIQGSCLGLLLFLLYVNDVTRFADNSVAVKLFADDTTILTHIKHTVG